uniref:Coiled-coil domain containing 180 n=1 Tax=Apteryx owenii TaxID=8824 RepID=A0A8B9PJM9_APTOW
EVRSKAKFSTKSKRIPLVKDSEICAGGRPLLSYQQKYVERMPYNDFTEKPVLYRYGTEEMEPFVLEPGNLLLSKLLESDRKIELLFKKIELNTDLEGFSIEVRQLMLLRKWIREMDETLKMVEWSRTDKLNTELAIFLHVWYVLLLFLFLFFNAQIINRALLANRRAIAKLFFNLMKTELKRELSHRLKWQDRVKDWKRLQKNHAIHSFREFMANEEIQNPPTVQQEMENMIKDQILLNERRLEFLHHLGIGPLSCFHFTLCCEILKSNNGLLHPVLLYPSDTHNVQCLMKIRIQYEKVQQKCLTEVQLCKVNLEELAKQNEQNCRDLYSYFQEAIVLWDVHQLKLSYQEDELKKKLDEYRWKQDNLIQEANLDIVLDKMRTASSEEKLKKYLEKAAASLDDIRAGYEYFLMDEVMAYPEAVLQQLISYSVSISQYFNVKEIFKQVSEAENMVEQQAESLVQEYEEEEQKTDSIQWEKEETHTPENEDIFAQETEETEKQEDGESIPHEGEETDHIEQGVSFAQEGEKENKLEGEGSLAQDHDEMGSLLQAEVSLNSLKIRLCFFEQLEKWFSQSLSNSSVIVAAKKEELNSELNLHLHLRQLRQEHIKTNIYNVRAAELLLHKERLECHCAGVMEALSKEKNEFLRLRDQQNAISEDFCSRIRDMGSVFLGAAKTEKLVSFTESLHSELLNHLEVIQISLRSYQNYLEEALGKLRDSSVDFLKACRLFSEGGNFSPEEIQSFCKRLQKECERIDSFEGLIMVDMEKMESDYFEQATELINQSETKFRYLSMDRVFMEKIQRFLTNLQVKIKSEVQTKTPELLVLKELKKRSQYLDCLLVNVTSLYDNCSLTTNSEISKTCTHSKSKQALRLKLLIGHRVRKTRVVLNKRVVDSLKHPCYCYMPRCDLFECVMNPFLFYLYLPKEFYRKDKHQITIPEDLPETFEHCAERLRQKLLSYQSQTDGYYNSCLIEFRDQLKLFEEELPYVSQLAVDSLLKEHEQKLSCSTDQIRHLFNKQLEDWERINSFFLYPISQQACAAECAQNFVSALAAFTEKLLLELDESITIDDVELAKIEMPREKISTLIRRKQAGLSPETCEVEQLIERGSRSWPGIPTTTLRDNSDYILCRETASVTTAKTTLGHVAVVEARDAVYEKYKCKLEQQFAQIKEESTAQLMTTQRWEDWWKQSIQKIKQLYT